MDCDNVSCIPDVCSDILGLNDSIVICTDGIWDYASCDKIVKVVRDTRNPEFICNLSSKKNNLHDDATALILTNNKSKNSLHTGLFKFFLQNGSNSSLSSEDEPSSTFVKVSLK